MICQGALGVERLRAGKAMDDHHRALTVGLDPEWIQTRDYGRELQAFVLNLGAALALYW